jgi:hypothetical protein
MPLNTNPFIEGIDPTSTFGGYASVLLQLIREAKPSSTYGMILFDTTAPDVTGTNAWRKTCVWLDLTNPNIPTVNVYKEGTSPGWININSVIAAGSIKTSMIADYNPAIINTGVTLPKLSPAGGTANQLIRVNAGATAFEFVSLSSLVTTGSINVGSLITTGIPAGQFRLAATYGPGVANWYTAQNVIDNLASASIPTDLLAVPGALTSRSQFLTARTADTFAAYRYFEPNVDMLNATMNGSKLQDGTLGPEKIYSAGVPDGSLLGKVSGVPEWVAPATITGYTAKYVSAQLALPTVGTTITPLTHGLGGQPINVYGVLVCFTAEYGYVANDEIPLNQVVTSSTNNEFPVFYYHATTTQIHCVRSSSAGLLTARANNGNGIALTDANWRIKFYATYTS